MSEISKLNIKSIKLPSDIGYLMTLSYGYSIGISFYETGKYRYIYLFKIEKDNFIQIQKYKYYGYVPLSYIELKNKTLLTVGRNSLYFYKIINDKLWRTTCLNRDKNNDYLAEVLQVIEIENGKIILENILGDIYVVEKIKNYKEINISDLSILDGYISNDNPEYEFTYKIPYEQRWKMTPIAYAQKNTVFFNDFKIDFSNEKYEKVKINENQVNKNRFIIRYRFKFNNFILLLLENSVYAIIDKKYYEIITKIELDIINEIIYVGNNKYLFTYKDKDKNKIFLLDLTDFDFKIIDSKAFNYNFKRDYYQDKVFITKYQDQIFVFDNTL